MRAMKDRTHLRVPLHRHLHNASHGRLRRVFLPHDQGREPLGAGHGVGVSEAGCLLLLLNADGEFSPRKNNRRLGPHLLADVYFSFERSVSTSSPASAGVVSQSAGPCRERRQ